MGRTAVITGGTKGIGLAIAFAFAEKGFDLAVCARSNSGIDAFKETMKDRFPGIKVLAQSCDVSNKAALQQFCTQVLQQFNTIDVLINNAGVFTPGCVIDEPAGTLEHLMETNLYSAYHMSRAFAQKMIQQNNGHIFNITSVAGLKAYPNGGSYSITKFAMMGLTKALREELKDHNIGVTSIAPGATLTNSWDGTDLPEQRFMTPMDVAKMVLSIYELSDRSVVEELVMRPMLGDI